MKRFLILISVMVFSLLMFTACGEKDFSDTIGQMEYYFSDNVQEITDKDEAYKAMVDAGAFESVKSGKELCSDIRYYKGSDYSLSIVTILVPYSNYEAEEFFESGTNDGIKVSDDIEINGLEGKIGYYTQGSNETHFIHLLRNGYFYNIELALYEDVDYPEGYLEDFARSIDFVDDEDMALKKETCGDITFKIPENYQSLKCDGSDWRHEEKGFAVFGEERTEMGVFYTTESECGFSAESMANYLANNLEEGTVDTEEKLFAKCYFVEGYDDEIGTEDFCTFEYKGNIYCFDMSNPPDGDIQYLYTIICSMDNME